MRRVIVLAGGRGVRLQPYTTVLPKPLMPIGDRPVLDILIRQLKRHQFDRVTIATGYLAELIEAFFRDGAAYGIPIDYLREREPLGTVGALALIDDLEEHFMVVNGDVLTDIDYAALLERHRRSDAVATIATTQRTVQISLGVILTQDDADPTRLTGYDEKPTLSHEVSMGVYCFSKQVIEHIVPGEHLDFPDLILRLVSAGRTVRAWRSPDFWLDIGRHEDYEQAQDEFERMKHVLLPEE